MKKIKIASLLTAAALMLSSFSTVAFAVEKTGTEALEVTAEKIDWADPKWAEYENENFGEDFDQYMVTYTATGHSLATTLGTGMNKTKASGTGISAYTIVAKLPAGYVEGEDYVMSLVSKAHTSVLSSGLENSDASIYGYVHMIGGNTCVIPAAGEAKTVVANDKLEIAKIIVTLNAGSEAVFSAAGSQCIIQDIKNNNVTSGTDVTVFPTVSADITLGATAPDPGPDPDPEPTEPTPNAGEGVAVTDGVNGKVWNEVKIENATLGTNYRAQFSIGDDKSTERQIFGIDENEGTVTFAVVLKTAKAVADIVLDILYDVVPQ